MKKKITIGSRGSQLALHQTNWVADRLREVLPEIEVEVVVIATTGDKILDAPLSRIGDKGLFTKELEAALLDERVDLAVHSLKDLPTTLPAGLTLGAVPEREDPRDALVCPRWSSIAALPPGARVGTSSLRRGAQLRALRPDVEVVDLRGNVGTRVKRVTDGELDAAVMACAGLRRIGLGEHIRQELSPETMVPAVSQGALGIEARADDAAVLGILGRIDDPVAAAETRAERTLLAILEGGCQVPFGALARTNGAEMNLVACVAAVDGSVVLKTRVEGSSSEPEELGRRAAEDLLRQGAADVIATIR